MSDKKLTVAKLKKDAKKLNEVKKVTILDEYYLNVRPNITSADMENIFREFGQWLQNKELVSVLGENYKDGIEVPLLKYFICFIIKNQTDLFDSLEIKIEDSIELLNVFDVLIEGHVNDFIVNELNKQHLSLIYVKFGDLMKTSAKIGKIKENKGE